MRDFDQTGWEWKEIPSPPTAPTHGGSTAVQLLIPLLAAGVLYLWGKVLLAMVVAGVGLLLVGLKVVAPDAHGAILGLLAALGKRLAKVVSYVALTVVYALVFAPVALLARLLRMDNLDLRRRPPGSSYWVEIPAGDPTRFFAQPFLLETRQAATMSSPKKFLRVGRLLYHTALTLFVVNLSLGYVVARIQDRREVQQLDPRSQSSVYDNENWADDYFREFAESNVRIYRPFIGWVRKDYQGRYVNIKDGHRQSYRASLNSRPPIRLYAFGASAMWGTGARDEHTIPSYLVKLAEKDGILLEAENYAESAFVNWQNILRLSELCAEGKAPAVVVFYEGAGDAGAKLQAPAFQRVHQNFPEWQEWIEDHDDPRRWFEKNSLLHIIARRLGSGLEKRRAEATILSTAPERVQRLAHDIVTTYRENAVFTRKVAEVYHFTPWFFWQPVVYTKKHPTAVEHTYERSIFGDLMAQVYRTATQEIRTQDFAIDLSTSFDEQDRTIYIDWAHIIEAGNEIVATKMYSHLRPALLELAATKAQQQGAHQ